MTLAAQHELRQTSFLAYLGVKPSISDRQRQVLAVIGKAPRPLTNSEIAAALGFSINRITPRVYELRKTGLLRHAGTRPCTITGSTAMTWERIA